MVIGLLAAASFHRRLNLGRALRTPYIDQSVHQLSVYFSIRLSVGDCLLGAYLLSPGPLTHRVSLGKGCVVTLNHVFRSKVKVIAELYVKFFVHGISSHPLVQSGSYCTQCVYCQRCAVTLNEVCRTFLEHIFSPFALIRLLIHPHDAFDQKVCNDLE